MDATVDGPPADRHTGRGRPVSAHDASPPAVGGRSGSASRWAAARFAGQQGLRRALRQWSADVDRHDDVGAQLEDVARRGSRVQGVGMSSTGQVAWTATSWLTVPSRSGDRAPVRWVPMTMRLACWAADRRTVAGSPCRTS